MSASNCRQLNPVASDDLDALPPRPSDIDAISALRESYDFHGDAYHLADHVWQELPMPVLDAAKDRDIRRLRGLLNDGRFPATCITAGSLSHMGWQSALNVVIERQLPGHARLLVEAGAEVNGFPLWCFSRAASRFACGRPSSCTSAAPLELPKLSEIVAESDVGARLWSRLTEAEVEARRTGRSRFWAESDFPRIDFPGRSATSSLTAAARVGDTDLYEFLVARGADESAWLQQKFTLGGPLTVSMLAAESPLHAAVFNQDVSVLQFLLDRGHKPDIFPISMPTRSLSPLMLSVTGRVIWREGLRLMLPRSNIELYSSIFGVHLIHLAVATLDIALLEEVRTGVKPRDYSISTTMLGHSLLHIACLPLDNTYVNMASYPVAISAREFRTFAAEWKSQGFHSLVTGPFAPQVSRRGRSFRRVWNEKARTERSATLSNEAKHQINMIRHVFSQISSGRMELSLLDVHGNTPLHYLAMARDLTLYVRLICELIVPNRGGSETEVSSCDLLASADTTQGAEPFSSVWTTSKNYWGYTPQRLYRSNLEAGNEHCDDFNVIPFWQDEMNGI